MTEEEYSKLFHKEQLNLVAFKMLFQCDKEVLRLVNAAIAAEREACAKACEARYMGDNNREDAEARRCAAAIRARGENT
jgi:hypothetical protein